jgi:signal peptidase I
MTESWWSASTLRRVFAILLSALLPGTGQIMLGRRAWAVFWAAMPLVSMALVPALGPVAAAAVLLTRLGSSVHAALMATGGAAPDPTGKTVALVLLLAIGTFAVTTGLRHDVVENVTMVDAAMYPALETGDYAVVDKTAYGLRLPFIGKVSGRAPRVGDLVAIDDPDKPDQLLVARVVALGPTSFEMKDGALVFGAGAEIGRRPLDGACQYAEVDKDKREFVDLPCVRFEEQAGGAGRTWQAVQPKEAAPSTQQVRQIAAGQVVVALDNRRGPAPWKIVQLDAVRGRVTLVWFSTAGPRGIRWNRVGARLK